MLVLFQKNTTQSVDCWFVLNCITLNILNSITTSHLFDIIRKFPMVTPPVFDRTRFTLILITSPRNSFSQYWFSRQSSWGEPFPEQLMCSVSNDFPSHWFPKITPIFSHHPRKTKLSNTLVSANERFVLQKIFLLEKPLVRIQIEHDVQLIHWLYPNDLVFLVMIE